MGVGVGVELNLEVSLFGYFCHSAFPITGHMIQNSAFEATNFMPARSRFSPPPSLPMKKTFSLVKKHKRKEEKYTRKNHRSTCLKSHGRCHTSG